MGTKQKKFGFFLILAIIVGVLVGWKMLQATSDKQQVISDKQELQKIRVGEAELGVEIADSAEEKVLGLGGRDSLGEDEGMIFLYDQPGIYGFWMKGMKFPLDFVWINDGEVVEVTESVPVSNEVVPVVYQPKVSIEAMIEVNAGWVKQNNVKIGDEVVYFEEASFAY